MIAPELTTKSTDKYTVIFVGGMFPQFCYKEIIEHSRGNIQYAADALQKSLIEGLSVHCKNLHVINLPFIGSWPKRYESKWSPVNKEQIVDTSNGQYILQNCRFLNVSGLKIFSRYLVAKQILSKLSKEANAANKQILIVYSLHTPFLKAAIKIKKKNPHVKVIVVALDLPEFMGTPTGIKNWVKKADIKNQNRLYSFIDGFILLTEAMKTRLIQKNQPYEIIEGIYNDIVQKDDLECKTESTKKVLFYSGTLARRYNIMTLVKAVQSLKRDDFILDIYGDGDSRNDIEQISLIDNRVRYCGQLPREEILRKQKKAFLLINPRNAEGEYTKYSFPSKTMEYLGSGTPTLLYKLPGIPSEYYDYCFTLNDTSINALSEKIENILNMTETQIKEMGYSARQFMLKKKNPYSQTIKIIHLIDKILYNK